MRWMDEDKFIWAVLAVVALFFTAQLLRAGLNWFLN